MTLNDISKNKYIKFTTQNINSEKSKITLDDFVFLDELNLEFQENPNISERDMILKNIDQIENKEELIEILTKKTYGPNYNNFLEKKTRLLYHCGDIITEELFKRYNIDQSQTKLTNYVNVVLNFKNRFSKPIFSTLWHTERCIKKANKHLKDNYSDEESEKVAKENLIIAKDAVNDLINLIKKSPVGDKNIKSVMLAGSLAGSQKSKNYGYSPKDDIDFLIITEESKKQKEEKTNFNRLKTTRTISSIIKDLSKKYNKDFCLLGGAMSESGDELIDFMTPEIISDELQKNLNGWGRVAYIHMRFGSIVLYEKKKGWTQKFRNEVIIPYDKYVHQEIFNIRKRLNY